MAREIINQSKNFTQIDAINSRNGVALKDMDGETIIVKALGIVKDVDKETGEVKEVGVIITNEGDCYTTISDNAIDVITDTMEYAGVKKLTYKVNVRKSKGGRDFISIVAGIAD